MILELVTLDIKAESNAEFEANLAKAMKVISQSNGFISIDIRHCIEEANRYVLLIHWQTLEDHTVGFRTSELFTQWRALICPFFLNPPFVQHFELKNLE